MLVKNVTRWKRLPTDQFVVFQERSLEFQREKEEKRLLEGRIAMLTGQMIGRGRRADGGAEGAVRHGSSSLQSWIVSVSNLRFLL